MRAFVVLGHKVPLTGDFSLNDLPGSAGRLDVLCRCVTAAFCLSHGIRRDVTVYLVLQDQIIVRLDGSRLKHLNPDERSTAALIQKALVALTSSPSQPPPPAPCKGDRLVAPTLGERPGMRQGEGLEIESTPGIFVSAGGLSDVLQRIQNMGLAISMLHEQGSPIRQAQLGSDVAFVLSDHLEFLPKEEALLGGFPRLSVGPLALHADHCIVIVHNELDLRVGLAPSGSSD